MGSHAHKGCLYLFFGFWTLFSLVMFTFAFGVPVYRILDAGSWDEVPCTIEEIALTPDHDDVTLRYRYLVDGQEYTSERYKLSELRGGNASFLEGWVAEHPPGSTAVCFVNPADPDEAVMERGWTNEWIFGLFSFVFVAIGIGGLRWIPWFVRQAEEAQEEGALARGGGQDQYGLGLSASTDAMREGLTGPVTLNSGRRPVTQAVVLGVTSLFWNGLTWAFMVVAVLPGKMPTPWQWMIYLFVVIGAGLVIAFVHRVLALFAPKISVTLDEAHLEPGETVDLEWRVHGNASSLRKLTFSLELRELTAGHEDNIATRRRRKEVLFETGERGPFERGHADVTLPADLQPSQEGRDRAERWVLVAQGEIPMRPNLVDEFVIWIHEPS